MLILLVLLVSFQNVVLGWPSMSKAETEDNINRVEVDFTIKKYVNRHYLQENARDIIAAEKEEFPYSCHHCLFVFSFSFSTESHGHFIKHLKWWFNETENNSLKSVMSLPSNPFILHVLSRYDEDNITALVPLDKFFISMPGEIPLRFPTVHNNEKRYYQFWPAAFSNQSITIRLSASCIDPNLVGENCDMKCRPSKHNETVAVCQSLTTGYANLCEYIKGQQVDSCQQCDWGVKDDMSCYSWFGSMRYPCFASSFVLLVFFIITVDICYRKLKKSYQDNQRTGIVI